LAPAPPLRTLPEKSLRRKMEQELLCPACRDYYKDPVTLRCRHRVCQSDFTGARTITCPVCSVITLVPEGGLCIDRGLQRLVEQHLDQQRLSARAASQPTCGFCEEQPAVKRCVQCDGVLCEECVATSHGKSFFKNHDIVDLGIVQNGVGSAGTSEAMCPEHTDEKLSFYCLDCCTAVCSRCILLGAHQDHQSTPVSSAFGDHREMLRSKMDRLTERENGTLSLLEKLQAAELEVQQGAQGQRNAIIREMDNLRELIETKRRELLSKSALEEKQKLTQLQTQVTRAEGSLEQIRQMARRADVVLSLTSEHSFLAVVLPLLQDVTRCSNKEVDPLLPVSSVFRAIHTDAQVRSVGELNLGLQQPGSTVLPVMHATTIAGGGASPMHAREIPQGVITSSPVGNSSPMSMHRYGKTVGGVVVGSAVPVQAQPPQHARTHRLQ